jgi:hypothetical protein
MLEIVVEEKNGIKRGGRGKEKGCSKVVFLILFFTKHRIHFFSLFLEFSTHKKLHKHPPTNNAIVQNKTFSLQTKSLTQILKIKNNFNNIIILQRK